MKKTLTVNLGGTVFHIDEDAYELLNDYLNNLRLHFKRQDGADEIVDDIERHISERFAAIVAAGAQVINFQHVEQIIAQVGKPEELAIDDEEDTGRKKEETKERTSGNTSDSGAAAHRLYRDPDNAKLGGVCSGLAAYLGWDVTVLRIVFFALMFLSVGTMLLLYLGLWLLMPEARTAAEKLAMRGENITVENIGKTVTDGFQRVGQQVNDFVKSPDTRSSAQRFLDKLVSFIVLVLKGFLLLFAIVLSPAIIVILVTLVALIISAISVLVGAGFAFWDVLSQWINVPDVMLGSSDIILLAWSISTLLLIGIPMIGLVYLGFQLFFNWRPVGTAWKISWFVLWIIALVMCFALMIPGLTL